MAGANSKEVAFELYGGVTEQGQALRANYALKWRAITDMKELGVGQYDMNGLINDGISSFKWFYNHEDRLVGAYDKPLSPLYIAWYKLLPLAKKTIQLLKSLILS